MIPGLAGHQLSKMEVDEKEFDRIEAIIHSMTPYERRHPELIKGSRRLRIAKGSGTTVQQVNQLVKQFGEMRKLMKGLQSGKMPDIGQLMRTAEHRWPPPAYVRQHETHPRRRQEGPGWRVVVADRRSPRDGRVIETIGRYNAQTDPSTIVLDEERVRHWLERGAQPSDRCASSSRSRASSPPASSAGVRELLEYLARALVDQPERVRVEEFEEDDGTIVLELSVADDDYGQVIGRGGRTAQALRTVIKAAAVKDNRRVLIDIVEWTLEPVSRPAGSAARTGSTAPSTSPARTRGCSPLGDELFVDGRRQRIERRAAPTSGRSCGSPATPGARRPRRSAARAGVPAERAPALEPGEYWAHELDGCAVWDGDARGGGAADARRCRPARRSRSRATAGRPARPAGARRDPRESTSRRAAHRRGPRLPRGVSGVADRRLHALPALVRLVPRAAPRGQRARARVRARVRRLPRAHAAAAGQVDDTPFGGGAGMVLRVDVVEAALRARYGDDPVALRDAAASSRSPRAAGCSTTRSSRSSPAEHELTLLCGRYEGFDERDPRALLLRPDLDRPLRAGRRRARGDGRRATPCCASCPGALGHEESAHEESFSAALERRARVPALHAPGGVARLDGPRRAAQRPPRPDPRVARRSSRASAPSDPAGLRYHRPPLRQPSGSRSFSFAMSTVIDSLERAQLRRVPPSRPATASASTSR